MRHVAILHSVSVACCRHDMQLLGPVAEHCDGGVSYSLVRVWPLTYPGTLAEELVR